MDIADFDALTFDCYGTLIDWERGILDALARAGASEDPEALLEAYAKAEAQLEAGPYKTYREVVARCYVALAEELPLREGGMDEFADAVGDWPAFPDSAQALRQLEERF